MISLPETSPAWIGMKSSQILPAQSNLRRYTRGNSSPRHAIRFFCISVVPARISPDV